MTDLGVVLLSLWLLSCLVFSVNARVSCMDHNNNEVDWFSMYKMPEIRESPHEAVREGFGYFYLDSNNIEWQMGKVPLNLTHHALHYTLQQVYDRQKSEDLAFMFYNDETPEKHVSEAHGHTKGAIGFDKDGGFWLVHSLPRFPPNTSYEYPPSGRMYGQTFLCISMKYSQFNTIGKQFLYTYPQIYHYHLPEFFANDNPNLAAAAKEKHVEASPWQHFAELNSNAGQQFLSFAKFVDFDADIYDAWLAPYFKTKMLTETWQNGRGKTPSNCTTEFKVENIQHIKIKDVDFKETRDHSKWGVTTTKQWICIGGINRMDEQKKRAGGMVCANISKLWQAFNESIAAVETCPAFVQLNSI